MKKDENNIHKSIMRMVNYGWSNQMIAEKLGITINDVEVQRYIGGKGNSFAKREFDLTEIEIERFGTYNPLLIELERIYLPIPCRLSFTERLNLLIQK
jgi:hypothetical protein